MTTSPFIPFAARLQDSAQAIPELAGIRLEFVLFALTLLGVAVLHKHALKLAAAGFLAILVFRLAFTEIDLIAHFFTGHTGSDGTHQNGEWRLLVNLMGLLLGFALLARHFEDSRVPELLPKYLPDGILGGTVLLGLVFILSGFLDNIAGAMIGCTIAKVVYRSRVHIGYLAAIVAASNAGGAGSVVGDTTTTMLWIHGVSAMQVLPAFVAAGAAWVVVAIFASRQQHRHQPITRDSAAGIRIDKGRLLIVAMILVGAILTSIYFDFPAAGVWIAILLGATIRSTGWHELPSASKGALFLVCLVMAASLMPVDRLPSPTWQTTLGIGFVSSVFDNIPLTKLAIQQGGYDWALLAYAVGFGGSMVWFGSSAGVAVSNTFPEARSVVQWLRHGWHIVLAYVVGFFVFLSLLGWEPEPPVHRETTTGSAPVRSLAQGASLAKGLPLRAQGGLND